MTEQAELVHGVMGKGGSYLISNLLLDGVGF